ncbi:MAG: hypothetical protein R3B89_29650 [Polyangiaceae bacterium]
MQLFDTKSPRLVLPSPVPAGLLALAAVLLLPSIGLAQTLTVNTAQFKRTPTAERGSAKLNLTISGADCRAGGKFSLPVSNATTGLTLAVRAGTCDSSNYNVAEQCQVVQTQSVKESNFTLEIPFNKIIVAARKRSAICALTSTTDGCTEETACTDLEDGLTTDVTLTISLDKSSVPAVTQTWDVSWDLAGPAGPSNVELGLGEEQLKVSWDALSDPDVAGYRFFCEPPRAASQTQSFEPMGPATGGTAGLSGGGAGGTSGAAGSGTSGAAGSGAGGSGTAGSSTAGSASDGKNGCAASALVPFKAPPDGYECGSTTANTSGTVSGLTNFTTYTVGVAAYDDLGNVGTLSELACATPEPVDDFFEVYRRAGGKGGNGYCAINQTSTPGMLGLVLSAMGLLVWRRRRMP